MLFPACLLISNSRSFTCSSDRPSARKILYLWCGWFSSEARSCAELAATPDTHQIMEDVQSRLAKMVHVLRPASIYLSAVLFGNMVWEVLQLPLYTIWQDGTFWQLVIAVTHCTAGDVLIATSALVLSLLTVGNRDWPKRHFVPVVVVSTAVGLGYTAFSEWLNVSVLGTWAYSQLMPVIAIEGTRIGVSPLLQWLIVPPAGFLFMRYYLEVSRDIRDRRVS